MPAGLSPSLEYTVWIREYRAMIALVLAVFLGSCNNQGEKVENLEPLPAVNQELAQQAAESLLAQYQTALQQEDSDLLQPLFDAATCGAFLREVQGTFQRLSIQKVQLTDVKLELTATPPRISFNQTLSVQDLWPTSLAQRTSTARTVWELRQEAAPAGVVSVIITSVTTEGPVFVVTTPGQLRPGIPARLRVHDETGSFGMAGAEVTVQETSTTEALSVRASQLQGRFTPPPASASTQPLQLRVRGTQGGEERSVLLQHHYQVRLPEDGVVERINVEGRVPCFTAIASAPDGTVWVGASGAAPPDCRQTQENLRGGRVYRIVPGTQTATLVNEFTDDPAGQVDDIVFDTLGRRHVLIRAQGSGSFSVLNRDVVVDQQGPPCITVNAFAPGYPFVERDPRTGEPRNPSQLSLSTRLEAANNGDVWLFGSDDGVARVSDAFRDGQCPQPLAVQYEPILRRENSDLLSNSVFAVVPGSDGSVWFGTVFGLTRMQEGRFTPVPFRPGVSFQGDVRTLEQFIRQIIPAILDAQPLTTIGTGSVSFVELFGMPLVKGDLIFTAVEDRQGRIWAGTLGGGIRRIERRGDTFQETLLTRQDGLGSNLIAALTVAPDHALWAVTQEGISRIQEREGRVIMRNFSALDGLPLRTRDITVDSTGMVWFAGDQGLFRLVSQGGGVEGVLQDATGRPVADADVQLEGTPFVTVTDVDGRFRLEHLPPGSGRLRLDGPEAAGGPFPVSVQEVEIIAGEQTRRDIILTPALPEDNRLVILSGNDQTGVVNQPLPSLLVVRVQNRNGVGIAGRSVTFTIIAGGGSLRDVQSVTDANGQATASLVLGTVAGTAGINRVEVGSSGVEAVVFTAMGEADRENAELIEISGNNQTGGPGEELRAPLIVRLQDQFGNPFSSERVTAEIQGEARFLSGSTLEEIPTDEQGDAEFFLQFNQDATPQNVLIIMSALGEARQFTATVLIEISVSVSGGGIVVEETGSIVFFNVLPFRNNFRGSVTRISSQVAPTTVSGCANASCTTIVGGNRPAFSNPIAMAIENSGSFVVLDNSPASILRIDPVSGSRQIVSGNSGNSLFNSPMGIAVEHSGSLVVTDSVIGAVVRVDPFTGRQMILSQCLEADFLTGECLREKNGSGISLFSPQAITVASDGYLFVTDVALHAVIQIDPLTGDRTFFSGCPTFNMDECMEPWIQGEGPPFLEPIGVLTDHAGFLIILDSGRRALIRINPQNRGRNIVPVNADFLQPQSIGIDGNGFVLVVDLGLAALIRVNLQTGAVSYVGFFETP